MNLINRVDAFSLAAEFVKSVSLVTCNDGAPSPGKPNFI